MNNNQVHSEGIAESHEPQKWWQRCWIVIISTSSIVLIIFAIILSLILKFVVFAPKESEITTVTLPSLATIISTEATTTEIATQLSSKQ
ncbi:unnamed protein product [Adineta steineri]|uniref:Uncharacterized protein n=1 Tax=Adineta steineri TaxID=433720 RepID=A0A815M3T9_9BILA|nr:unnamed protein product [Adineta steineri]CAF4226327.1 unnamed protein product [Adineta steineri]